MLKFLFILQSEQNYSQQNYFVLLQSKQYSLTNHRSNPSFCLLYEKRNNETSLHFHNKIISLMSERATLSEAKNSMLQQLFNRAKPKARYISQTHIEEETSSIAKEIINGDIEVRKTKGNFNPSPEKNTYEDMLRRKYMQQIEKEKQALEHKLGYIENSLTSFEKYEYLRKRSVLQDNLSSSRQSSEEWRKEFEEEMKKIQQKKREIAERSKEKDMQAEQLRAKVREQERARQKAELEQSIKRIKSRSQKREEMTKEEKEKVKEILTKKQLFQKMEEKFNEKQEDVLEQRKKKLAQIRQLKHPINLQEILEHEQRVLETLKQKESVREMEKRMNGSRARSYRPSYQSAFYKQIAAPPQTQTEQNPKQKLEKMRQFSEQVKSKFIPEIDEMKRKQMEEKLQKEAKHRVQRQEKEKELIQKPKLKGLEYLQLVKNLPKKKDSPPPTAPKGDRIEYKNYLGNLSVDMGKSKPWKTILSKGDHKVETALLLQYQSQKLQQKLKRKEEYVRCMKQKDDGSIDQEYYDMVKAKLDLLAKE